MIFRGRRDEQPSSTEHIYSMPSASKATDTLSSLSSAQEAAAVYSYSLGSTSAYHWGDDAGALYGSYMRRRRGCPVGSCVLWASMLLVILGIAAVVAVAAYLAVSTTNGEAGKHDIIFDGSFKVVIGDNFTIGLSDPSSRPFLEKASKYKTMIESVYQQSPLSRAFRFCRIEAFHNDSLRVHFRLHLDRRKIPSHILNTEKAVKDVLIQEVMSVHPVSFQTIAVDIDSLQVVRSFTGASDPASFHATELPDDLEDSVILLDGNSLDFPTEPEPPKPPSTRRPSHARRPPPTSRPSPALTVTEMYNGLITLRKGDGVTTTMSTVTTTLQSSTTTAGRVLKPSIQFSVKNPPPSSAGVTKKQAMVDTGMQSRIGEEADWKPIVGAPVRGGALPPTHTRYHQYQQRFGMVASAPPERVVTSGPVLMQSQSQDSSSPKPNQGFGEVMLVPAVFHKGEANERIAEEVIIPQDQEEEEDGGVLEVDHPRPLVTMIVPASTSKPEVHQGFVNPVEISAKPMSVEGEGHAKPSETFSSQYKQEVVIMVQDAEREGSALDHEIPQVIFEEPQVPEGQDASSTKPETVHSEPVDETEDDKAAAEEADPDEAEAAEVESSREENVDESGSHQAPPVPVSSPENEEISHEARNPNATVEVVAPTKLNTSSSSESEEEFMHTHPEQTPEKDTPAEQEIKEEEDSGSSSSSEEDAGGIWHYWGAPEEDSDEESGEYFDPADTVKDHPSSDEVVAKGDVEQLNTTVLLRRTNQEDEGKVETLSDNVSLTPTTRIRVPTNGAFQGVSVHVITQTTDKPSPVNVTSILPPIKSYSGVLQPLRAKPDPGATSPSPLLSALLPIPEMTASTAFHIVLNGERKVAVDSKGNAVPLVHAQDHWQDHVDWTYPVVGSLMDHQEQYQKFSRINNRKPKLMTILVKPVRNKKPVQNDDQQLLQQVMTNLTTGAPVLLPTTTVAPTEEDSVTNATTETLPEEDPTTEIVATTTSDSQNGSVLMVNTEKSIMSVAISTSILSSQNKETLSCAEANDFRCRSGECVSSHARCNQIRDCRDNSDEANCSCADHFRAQFLTRKICDGIQDCSDLSDENDCEWCRPGQFICPNSRVCVDQEAVCDGRKDCPYGDDEHDCVKVAPSERVADTLAYHNSGYLLVRKEGKWGKLCLQNFENVVSKSRTTWEIPDLGRAVCKALTFNDFERVDRMVDPEPMSRAQDSAYYEIFYSVNSSEPTPRASLNFNPTRCARRDVVHVTCKDLQCGVSPRAVVQRARSSRMSRIVGGANSQPGSWPWQAALYKEGEFQCGGTLVSERWLVSAGHCFYNSLDDHWVARLGSLRRGTPQLSPFEQLRTVSHIILHPEYVNTGFINDISLLRLSEPVSFTDYVRPVCLPPPEADVNDGRYCTVIGWGQLFETGRVFPDTLQEVQLPIISTMECRKRTLFLPLYRVTDNMFCAGFDRGGRDACLGDSGGPLMCQESNGHWVLYGVTSNGYGCARVNRPGVYTKVSNYMPWIKRSMESTLAPRNRTACTGIRCHLGECLPQDRICNGFVDCQDGRDEDNCW